MAHTTGDSSSDYMVKRDTIYRTLGWSVLCNCTLDIHAYPVTMVQTASVPT
ncbi:hypothetical protein RO3G_02718 [Rhizopus delemar RA 99-880]|uniref:Uncharacterized protein n=1 Tax=Rhizopus delemar (strain RA 99-880 / ATCC MYA-4621 / FGSC 9543 / NRRL 43880) TaxID=246409 RepID=I1BP84_RHIO9|nr:hypothetical protein RO3G_02718 [Rhizopus delemar RA 99-880]|eukprot:EIE78014.1 hypothetical protein RO3G_02718 [Rhizopus delemar RA 99-880]